MSKRKELHLYDLYIYDEYYNPPFKEDVVRAGTLAECQEAYKNAIEEWIHDCDEEEEDIENIRDGIQWLYDLKDGERVNEEELFREYFISFVKTVELCPKK